MSDNEKSTQTEEPNFRYNAALAQDIENKWQKIWDEQGTFWAANVNGDLKDGKGRNAEGRTAYFAMDMFPYPSGKGLHVGHPLGYLASDVVSRYHRMKGENVLHAMGYDAFGLPAEQYAVQTGQHPRVTTEANIANMSRQLHRMGLSFDNRRTFATIDPGYVRWTQWIFSRIYDSWYDEDATNPSGSKGSARPIAELVAKFESGEKAIPGHESDGKQWSDLTDAEQQDILNDFRLAYISKSPVNWCPGLGTVLANEEVTAEGKSERGNFPVFQRELRQWSMRITKYGHRLIADLDGINWPEKVKLMQRNWIGESHGASVHFIVATADGDKDMEIYTTRPDTLFGTTYMVISPEHPTLKKWLPQIANRAEVEAYQAEAARKSDFERGELNKDKTGVRLDGIEVINPATGKVVPMFVSDYVLMGYGTGIVMGVPGHDQRDWEFATKFGLPIIEVVKGGDVTKEAFVAKDDSAVMVNSGFLNGMTVKEAIPAMKKYVVEQGFGKEKVNYKLRDWVFSRQRYWGEPIPLVNCPKCGWVALPEEQLPLVLPQVDSYEPTDDGESPLSKMTDWVNTTCPCCGGPAKRETDTMPQWAGSSWYFLRYMDPHNDKALASKEALEYWSPVDWYNGGMEHTTLHLLYSRFWHKFLYDIGVVPTKEPYAKRTSHGMILGEGGEKMSKSRGNVVNPNDIVAQYGADTMRLHIMFIGDFEKAVTWSNEAVKGSKRFLDRCWNLMDLAQDSDEISEKNEALIHKTIKKVTADIDDLKMNTAIAALMAMVNEFYTNGLTRGDLEQLMLLLSPFAPHMVEEMWELTGYAGKTGKMAMQMPWPAYDEGKTVDTHVDMAIQVNGKLKGAVTVPAGSGQETVMAAAMELDKVRKATEGMTVVKTILVKDKLMNLIVKPAK